MICICVSMSMEIVGDAASFDAELFQLSEVSPLALKSNPSFVETLFEHWLSLPDTNRLVPVPPIALQINIYSVLRFLGHDSFSLTNLSGALFWFLNCYVFFFYFPFDC